MASHNAVTDRQSQSDAPFLTRVEGLEDIFHLFSCDAFPRIPHEYFDSLGVFPFKPLRTDGEDPPLPAWLRWR